MKDVSELLAKRLKRLEAPFSREWLADFSAFMQFMQTNSFNIQILEAIKKEKEEAHASLTCNLKRLFEDGKRCLEEIEVKIEATNHSSNQISNLLKSKVNSKDLTNPFFELESLYYEYYKAFASLLRNLTEDDANIFISKYCILSCMKLQGAVHLNVDLSFSPYLQKCQHEIEILSGQRTSSMWSKWDVLLKWAEWTKNGIAPTNDAFERNLSHLFVGLKIPETVQSFGLFLLERLANVKRSITIHEEVSLKALELFLDKQEQYWIIVHKGGENLDKEPFFIKKLQRSTRSYRLLKLLLKAEPYSIIDFPTLAHTLGELELKKELKKVFFPTDKFAGSMIQLSDLNVEIDPAKVLEHLMSIKKTKKRLPSFNWGHYFSTSFPR